MTRWEYLVIDWEASVAPSAVSATSRYYVRRPDGNRDALADGLVWCEHLNTLGADGWELVAERMNNSVVFGDLRGYHNVAGPLTVTFTFKRPTP